MTLFFNILFAWVAIILGVFLSAIWLIKFIQKKIQKTYARDFIKRINKSLRKNHINLGYLFLISLVIHGILSSYPLISFNYGTISIIIWMLLWYTFVKKMDIGNIWIQKHRELTIVLIVITILHIFEVGGFIGFDRIIDNIKSDLNPKINIGEINISNYYKDEVYKDGIYEGTGYGYRPELKVIVSIKGGAIDEVSIASHNEVGVNFYKPAFDYIPKEIIDKQTYDIDALSGSTYSSRGIIEAVGDALSKAKK